MKKRKFNLSGAVALVISLLVLIVVVPINLIVSYYDKLYDMTPAKKYTLHEKTVKLLNETSDKDIEVYFLYKNISDLQTYPPYLPLYHTLSQLEERSNVTLKCSDPNEHPELADYLNPTGNLEFTRGDVYVKCGDVIKRVGSEKIFQTDSEGRAEYAGEELIAGAIQTCTSGSLPMVYLMLNHSDKTLDKNFSVYAASVKANNYDVQELDLNKTGAVPDNTAILYLIAPQEDITDTEKDLLLEYLDNGGSLSVLIPPCDTPGRFTNIDYVLRKYGLEIDYNVVTETNAFNQLYNQSGEQSESFLRVTYPPKTDSFNEDLTTDINYLIQQGDYSGGISNVRSMTMLPDSQYDAGAFEISPVIQTVPSVNSKYSTVSKAMGGDEITAEYVESEDLNNENTPLDLGYYSYNMITGGKIFIVGTSDPIDNENFAMSTSGTEMLILMSNTWLKDIDVQMGIGYKINAYDTMEFADAKQAKKVMSMTALLPVSIIVIGIFVWLKRRYS